MSFKGQSWGPVAVTADSKARKLGDIISDLANVAQDHLIWQVTLINDPVKSTGTFYVGRAGATPFPLVPPGGAKDFYLVDDIRELSVNAQGNSGCQIDVDASACIPNCPCRGRKVA